MVKKVTFLGFRGVALIASSGQQCQI